MAAIVATVLTPLWQTKAQSVQSGGLYFELTEDENANHYAIVVSQLWPVAVGYGDGAVRPSGDVTIPETVDFPNPVGGTETVPVKAIGDAFQNIPYEEPLIKSLTIPAGVTKFVGNGSMSWIPGLESITLLNTDPSTFTGAEDAFGASNMTGWVVLYVPEGTKEAYKNTAPWKWFRYIREIGEKNYDFTYNGLFYKINENYNEPSVTVVPESFSSVNGSVEAPSYYNAGNAPTGDIVIPEKAIDPSGTPYTVVGIGENAFCLLDGISSIDIPATVYTADSRALESQFADLYVHYEDAGYLAKLGGAFQDAYIPNTTLHIPCGLTEEYNSKGEWPIKYFKEIKEECAKQCTVRVEVTNEPNGGWVEGAGTYSEGDEVSLIAHPNDGFTYAWPDGYLDDVRSFTVTGDTTIYIAFERIARRVLITGTFAGADGGALTHHPGKIVGANTYYEEGDTTTLEAVLGEGWKFIGWSDGNNENPRTISVSSDSTFTAIVSNMFKAAVEIVSGRGHGTVEGEGEYPYGSSVRLYAIPDENWTYKWEDGYMDDAYDFTITQDTILRLSFIEATPETERVFITGTFVGADGIPLTNFPGKIVGGNTYYEVGDTTTLEAVLGEGWKFMRWSDGNNENPRTISVSCDSTFTALVSDMFTASVEIVSGQGHGTVEGEGSYKYGSTIRINAIPDENWTYKWEDGYMDDAYDFTITQDTIIRLSFVEATPEIFTIATSAFGPGKVEGGGSYEYGQTATLTAIPEDGYKFAQWFVNGQQIESISNPLELIVTEDMRVTAVFSQDKAYDFKYGQLYYKINEDGETVTVVHENAKKPFPLDRYSEGNSPKGDIVVPSEVPYNGRTYKVKAIGSLAFYCCNEITTLVVSEGITDIGYMALAWLTYSGNPKLAVLPSTLKTMDCTALDTSYIPALIMNVQDPDDIKVEGESDRLYTGYIKAMFVPCGTADKWRASEWGKEVSNILEQCDVEVSWENDSLALNMLNLNNNYVKEDTVNTLAAWYDATSSKANTVSYISSYSYGSIINATSVSYLSVPATVRNLAHGAFIDALGLKGIIYPENGLGDYMAEDGILYNRRGKKVHTVPAGLDMGTRNLRPGVDGIGDYAFGHNTETDSICIPDGVKSIGNWAFVSSKKLRAVRIAASVERIGEEQSGTRAKETMLGGTFAYCNGLTDIYVGWDRPLPVPDNTFDGVDTKKVRLHVPNGTKDAYKSAKVWKDFIVMEFSKETAVEGIAADNRPTAIYDLGGRRQEQMRSGVNIVRMADGTTRKVVRK